MNCSEAEILILDVVHDPRSARGGALLQDHLAACPACAAFWRQQARLDAELTSVLGAPVLSPGFNEALYRKIEALPPSLEAEQIEAKKRQMDAEYEALLRRLDGKAYRRRLWRFSLIFGAGSAALGLLIRFAGNYVDSLQALQGGILAAAALWALWLAAAVILSAGGLFASRLAQQRR